MEHLKTQSTENVDTTLFLAISHNIEKRFKRVRIPFTRSTPAVRDLRTAVFLLRRAAPILSPFHCRKSFKPVDLKRGLRLFYVVLGLCCYEGLSLIDPQWKRGVSFAPVCFTFSAIFVFTRSAVENFCKLCCNKNDNGSCPTHKLVQAPFGIQSNGRRPFHLFSSN